MRTLGAVEGEFGGIFGGVLGCGITIGIWDLGSSSGCTSHRKVDVGEKNGCGNCGKDITECKTPEFSTRCQHSKPQSRAQISGTYPYSSGTTIVVILIRSEETGGVMAGISLNCAGPELMSAVLPYILWKGHGGCRVFIE